MSNEERPRLSLRLRGLSQDSGEAPPASPPEPARAEPQPPAAAPAEPSAVQQFKPRLNSLLSSAAAASPGSGFAPAPAPEAVPSPAPEPEPPPLPAAAYNAPASPPPFRPLNPANFPPPPGFGKAKAPPPAAAAPAPGPYAAGTSGHRAGITLLILLALVIGSAAFVYFADPLGLFVRAPAPSPIAKDPVPIAPPEPEPEVAQSAPASEPEATPEPPPQQELETLPPPPPPPQPEIINAIAALKFSGARMNSGGGSIMLGAKVYNAGEVINPELGITFVSFSDGTFTFRDDRGATYQRRF
mgnify:CR=1 FL=1